MNYALVTGTDHGLGLALTDCLLARGYFVIGCPGNQRRTGHEKNTGIWHV